MISRVDIGVPMTPKVVEQSRNQTKRAQRTRMLSFLLIKSDCCSGTWIILLLFKYIIWLNWEVLTRILDRRFSFVGNTEIDVDIKKYYCRAGIKSIQVSSLLLLEVTSVVGP